jgi:Cytochrome bd terminal oxidase subunit I
MAIRNHGSFSLYIRSADHRHINTRRRDANRLAGQEGHACLRMTKFFGKISLINFAVGVVTGIVQDSSSG